MRRFIFCFVFIPFTLSVSAQGPGYLGHHLSLYYDANFCLSIQPNNDATFGINFRNDFSADYVVGKSVALGVSTKIISTTVNNIDIYDDNLRQEFSGDVNVSGPAYSFYIKDFAFGKRGYLAPVGVFTKWEFVYTHLHVTTEHHEPDYESGYYQVRDIKEIASDDVKLYGIIFSFGRQSLFMDRFFLTTGGSIGFFPRTLSSISAIGFDYYAPASEFHTVVEARMAGYFLFNFTVGIGLLTF